jgi:hypothetical protein
VLQNSWELPELDLDKKLQEMTASEPASAANRSAPGRIQ